MAAELIDLGDKMAPYGKVWSDCYLCGHLCGFCYTGHSISREDGQSFCGAESSLGVTHSPILFSLDVPCLVCSSLLINWNIIITINNIVYITRIWWQDVYKREFVTLRWCTGLCFPIIILPLIIIIIVIIIIIISIVTFFLLFILLLPILLLLLLII